MSGDAQPPPVLHRSFLVFQHIASKLRKTSYKSSSASDVAAGFEIMLQGKTLRDWAPNLLTLLAKDITSSFTSLSSCSTFGESKIIRTVPLFDSTLIIDCAAAADTPKLLDISPPARERVLAEQTPFTFSGLLQKDFENAQVAINTNSYKHAVQFLLLDPLGARQQLLHRHRVLAGANRYFNLPLKDSFFPLDVQAIVSPPNLPAATQLQNKLAALTDTVATYKAELQKITTPPWSATPPLVAQ